ncbi:hypothetical protein PVAP13_7KG260700 [Panicum virgatum]|uniref:Uncharacterized protein n=1 Tax=Panicum virgatum TaxID=38727 RepID=A0A8T0QHF0_PANVG|nr:hypothetical protein PVAP13_7KG260700 [Panicum virgatum]
MRRSRSCPTRWTGSRAWASRPTSGGPSPSTGSPTTGPGSTSPRARPRRHRLPAGHPLHRRLQPLAVARGGRGRSHRGPRHAQRRPGGAHALGAQHQHLSRPALGPRPGDVWGGPRRRRRLLPRVRQGLPVGLRGGRQD